MAPGQTPVPEALASPRGLIVATGFPGQGFALGPAAGWVVSEIAAGVAPSVDLERFRYGRFAEPAAHPLEASP